MSQYQSYKDLNIYKKSHELAVYIHEISLKLPRFELYEVGSQIRRSSKSVPANIVEGFSRKCYRSEYARYLIFAHGSCNETIQHLEMLYETKSLLSEDQFNELKIGYDQLGRMINKFIFAVRKG